MNPNFEGLERGGRQVDNWIVWRQVSLICILTMTTCVVLFTSVVGYHYVRLTMAIGSRPEPLVLPPLPPRK